MGALLHVKLLWAHFRKSVPFLNLRVLRVFKKRQGWAAAAEYETAVMWRGSGSPYSFSSTAVPTEYTGQQAHRGRLDQHSLLCVAFLCSSRAHAMPVLHASRRCMEIFSPKMWDVVLLSQLSQWGRLSWDCLHSDLRLKTIAKKCRLHPLRADRSSVTFLEFFSRMARIETSWE